MRRQLLIVVAFTFLATGLALAAGPSTMSYQGRLTDTNGSPVADGSYSVVFTIYDAAVSGTTVWTETQNVNTVGGLFSVVLGTVTPLSDQVFAGPSRYLGIKVGVDPEMTPRVALTSFPWAFRTATVDSASGGTVTGGITLESANGGQDRMILYPGRGAGVDLYDEAGNLHTSLEPDVTGSGGYLWLGNGASAPAFEVDGNAGANQPIISMYSGSELRAAFDLRKTGDSSVILPDSAIDSYEILDEPGIASNVNTSIDTLSFDGDAVDLVTVTISTPAPGYVVLNGQVGRLSLSGTTPWNWVWLQIEKTHVALDMANGTDYGSDSPDSAQHGSAGHVERIYYEPAGTHTYILEAVEQGWGLDVLDFDRLTALYYPTSYGSVAAVVPASEAGSFESATPVAESGVGPGAKQESSGYKVDLRELELKVAKQRAALAASESALLEARMQKQREAMEAARAAAAKGQ